MQTIRKTLVIAFAMLVLATLVTTSPLAKKPTIVTENGYHVTFDNGPEGWNFDRANCSWMNSSDGNPGANLTFSRLCDDVYHLTGWFEFELPLEAPIKVAAGASAGARISIDLDVNFYDYISFFGVYQAEEWRSVVLEIRDYDNPYTDPETGYSWPWTSVQYVAGTLPNRNAGWKTFNIDIEELGATEMPENWVGFGGPENPNTYMPQLPPDRTFGDVIAGADEIRFSSLEPGYFYSYNFAHEINVDNIRIEPLGPSCEAVTATVYVDTDGVVHGGANDGGFYNGILEGTEGNDVIVGTGDNDQILGMAGNDVICGQAGDDQIDGGDGMDMIDGGAGADTCTGGEITNACQQ